MNALEYFTLNEWIWKTDNFSRLIERLNDQDRKKFFIDVKQINWNDYLLNYILGVRKYLLQEDPSTIPAAKRKLNRQVKNKSTTNIHFSSVFHIYF